MGWGTDFNIDIFLSKQMFNSLMELEDYIKEREEDLINVKTKISMFASCSVNTIVPKEWKEQPLDFINMQINELLDALETTTVDLFKLELYKEYLQNLKTKKIEDESSKEK